MFQQLTLVGFLGRDPELRFTPQGKAVTSLNVAANSGYGEHEVTAWFRVSVWGNQAEACNQHLKKGSAVLVVGRLRPDPETGNPRTYQRKDGSTGSSYEVTALDVKFLPGGAVATDEDYDNALADVGAGNVPF